MLHLAPELGAEKPLAAEPQLPASSEGLGLRAQSSSGSPLWPPLAWLRGLRAGEANQTGPGFRAGWACQAATGPGPLPWAPIQHMAKPLGMSCRWAPSWPAGDQGSSADLPPSLDSSASLGAETGPWPQARRNWEHFLSRGLAGGGRSHLKHLGLSERRAWEIQLI